MVANPRATNSQKKKKKKKPKPNLKTDGSKPNPRMVAKTEIRNGETELIASALNSSNIGHHLGLASRIGDWNSTDRIGDSFLTSHLNVLPSPMALPFSLSLLAPSTLRYFIFTLHFSSL